MSISQNFPAISPTLNLNFARSKKLDPRITFTRTSSATRTNAQGLIEVVSANTPRFDHSYNSSTGSVNSLGLLIEESRTNLISYSQDFTNALWQTAINRATCDATTGIDDPSGGTTASRWSSGASPTQELIYRQTGTALTGLTCTKSIWIRRVSNNGTVSFFIGDNVGVSVNSQLDSVPVGTWVRCSVTRTIVGNSGDTRNYIAVYPGTDGQPTTIDIWGDQVEAGAFPTSYIPTVASTVTRSADNASMTGTNFSSWYNSTEGTLFAAARINALGGSNYPGIVYVDDGTVSNCIGFYINDAGSDTIGAEAYISNVAQYGLSSSATTANQLNKVISAYKVNDFAATFNIGSNTVQTDTSGSVPTVNRLIIGLLRGSNAPLNGTVAQFLYYPRRLTNSQLQNLTK